MKKILTIVLDGFGMREDIYGNAVKNAGMNNFISIWNTYPHCLLKSSGKAIGLPDGQCGNSDLGHRIIGAGREVNNKLKMTYDYFKKNLLKNNPKYLEMLKYLKQSKKDMHIIFLLSDGGVSSHIDHLKLMLNELKKMFEDDYIHTKRFRIKPFSLLWWVIRSGQAILVVAGFFVFYMMMWSVLA